MKTRKNLEIKIQIDSIAKYRRLAVSYAETAKKKSHFTETQKDIYYSVKDGRLKLRIINGRNGVLIFYRRSSSTGKRVSNYILAETTAPDELDSIMKTLHGIKVTVDKKREIFIADNVRIHLDSVKGLGKYLEFEVIFRSIKTARSVLRKLIEHFKIDESAFIKGSYSDLLIKKGQ